MRPLDRRNTARLVAVAAPTLTAATIAVAVLESYVNVPNASAVYLVAVVATAVVAGTAGAIVASVASFLLYDFFFTVPTLTFTIRDPSEWLSVVLLLFVGIVVGQLAALQRMRAEIAQTREREARALFQVSRALATRESTAGALSAIVAILDAETRPGAAVDRPRAGRCRRAGRRGHGHRATSRDHVVPGAATDAGRRSGGMVPGPSTGDEDPAGLGPGHVPGADRGGRRGARIDLGRPRAGRPGAGPDRDAPPGRGGRPDRPGARPRPARSPRRRPRRSPARATP